MLYFLLRVLAVLSLERFFDKIVVEHGEKVNYARPTIFVANHPNTMMDALVVGYAVKRRILFVAKSSLFANRISSWFLTKFGVIPIYRRQDDPANMARNEEVFRKLYEFLELGHSFLIFPEGTSEPLRRIQRIKTGTARIALGAEERNDFSLGVQIVPIGLNYSDYERFRSNVYCRFGRPIFPNDYRAEYLADPVRAVKDLTEKIRLSLEHLTTTVAQNGLRKVVSALEEVYKKELIVDLGMDKASKSSDFFATKGIIEAVEWFNRRQPERARNLGEDLQRYLRNLHRLHLKDEFLSPKRSGVNLSRRVRAWLSLVLGFPVFLWGAANNFVPYVVPRWFASRFVKQETFISSVKLLVGIGSFVVAYTIQTWLVWYLFHSRLITVLYAASLPLSGNFALYYARRAENYRQHLVFLSLFYRRKILIYRLIQQRIELIDALNRARDEFLAATRESVREH